MQFKSYKGDLFDLGQAEEFIYLLSRCESFPVLLQGLLYKTEFSTKFHVLQQSFKSLIDGCHEVLKQNYLKDFLHVMLQAGNFLNNVSIGIKNFLFLTFDNFNITIVKNCKQLFLFIIEKT